MYSPGSGTVVTVPSIVRARCPRRLREQVLVDEHLPLLYAPTFASTTISSSLTSTVEVGDRDLHRDEPADRRQNRDRGPRTRKRVRRRKWSATAVTMRSSRPRLTLSRSENHSWMSSGRSRTSRTRSMIGPRIALTRSFARGQGSRALTARVDGVLEQVADDVRDVEDVDVHALGSRTPATCSASLRPGLMSSCPAAGRDPRSSWSRGPR